MAQDASSLKPLFEQELILVAWKDFDTPWVLYFSFYDGDEASIRLPSPVFWMKDKATTTSWNFCASFLPHFCMFMFLFNIMVLLNCLSELSTIPGWQIFTFVEITTLQSQIWCHCLCRRILVFVFMFSQSTVLFGILLSALLQLRLQSIFQVAVLCFDFRFSCLCIA